MPDPREPYEHDIIDRLVTGLRLIGWYTGVNPQDLSPYHLPKPLFRAVAQAAYGEGQLVDPNQRVRLEVEVDHNCTVRLLCEGWFDNDPPWRFLIAPESRRKTIRSDN